MYSAARRRFNAQTHEDGPAAPPSPDEALLDRSLNLTAGAEFDRVLSALRDALAPEYFTETIRVSAVLAVNLTNAVLREAPILVRWIHNPTAAQITVNLSLDGGSDNLVAVVIAANSFAPPMLLTLPHLCAGIIGPAGSYATIGGELLK